MSERSDTLSLVGKRIKEVRKQQKLNLKELATRTAVSAGLLSKIENFRAVPSLPVLHRLAEALQVTMSDLVSLVEHGEKKSFVVIRRGERTVENREDSPGMHYETVLGFQLPQANLRTTIVTMDPGVQSPTLYPQGKALILLMEGLAEYSLEEQAVQLQPGDALYFDGSTPHQVRNLGTGTTVFFCVCFHGPH